MTAWDDITASSLGATHRFADGQTWRLAPSGLLIGNQVVPSATSGSLPGEVFDAYGADMQTVATSEAVPLELLIASVCTEAAEAVGAAGAATLSRVVGDWTVAGCTGLRGDLAEAYGTNLEGLATPANALTAAARHMVAAASLTGLQPPLVAAAYNSSVGIGLDARSPWRMASFDGDAMRISRFVGWFNAAVGMVLADPSIVVGVPSFAVAMASIVEAPPQPAAETTYLKPESQAAVDAGMMVISEIYSDLRAIWALDDTTLDQIGSVARDSASGLGLPLNAPAFAYPDKSGTQRILSDIEVQKLYKAMRDFVAQIRMFDVDRADSLPGIPVTID